MAKQSSSEKLTDARLYDASENEKILNGFFNELKGYELIQSEEIDPDRCFHIVKIAEKTYILEITDYFQSPRYEQLRIEQEGYIFKGWVYPLGKPTYRFADDDTDVEYRVPFIKKYKSWYFFVAEIETERKNKQLKTIQN